MAKRITARRLFVCLTVWLLTSPTILLSVGAGEERSGSPAVQGGATGIIPQRPVKINATTQSKKKKRIRKPSIFSRKVAEDLAGAPDRYLDSRGYSMRFFFDQPAESKPPLLMPGGTMGNVTSKREQVLAKLRDLKVKRVFERLAKTWRERKAKNKAGPLNKQSQSPPFSDQPAESKPPSPMPGGTQGNVPSEREQVPAKLQDANVKSVYANLVNMWRERNSKDKVGLLDKQLQSPPLSNQPAQSKVSVPQPPPVRQLPPGGKRGSVPYRSKQQAELADGKTKKRFTAIDDVWEKTKAHIRKLPKAPKAPRTGNAPRTDFLSGASTDFLSGATPDTTNLSKLKSAKTIIFFAPGKRQIVYQNIKRIVDELYKTNPSSVVQLIDFTRVRPLVRMFNARFEFRHIEFVHYSDINLFGMPTPLVVVTDTSRPEMQDEVNKLRKEHADELKDSIFIKVDLSVPNSI